MFTQELADALAAAGVGMPEATIGQSSGYQYPRDKASVTIVDTGGAGSSGTQNDTATQHATASLTSRAPTFGAAYAMAKAAYDALGGANGIHNAFLSGTWYVGLRARQQPTDLGADGETGLAMVVFNVEAEKQPS